MGILYRETAGKVEFERLRVWVSDARQSQSTSAGGVRLNEKRFRLLSIRSGNPPQFAGPLARVLGPRMKDLAVTRALGALSRLSRSGEMELLGMTTQVTSEGRFSARATGPLGRLPDARKAVEGVQKAVQARGKPIIRRGDTLIYTSYQPPIPTKASMKLLASRLALEMEGHPQPTVCTLQLTTRCQADCVHCSAARYKRPGEQELTTDEWKRIIRESEALGSVTVIFTGGEPLLRRDIFDLIEWVDKDEAVALIFCNGLLLDETNVRKLADAGLWAIHISIDSPNPAAHDEMRHVRGCFDKAIEGLKRCKDAGLLAGISTYATPERLRNGQVVEMIELAGSVGADEITIFDVVPTGRLLHQDRRYLLTDEDKEELCRIEARCNEGHPLPSVITQAHINGPTGNGCYAGWCQFYMTAYGEMTPCDFTPLAFGNAREESVEAIWNRIAHHEGYRGHKSSCRMQDQHFRAQWVDRIPSAGPFPYPIDRLDQLDLDLEEDERAEQGSSIGIKG